MKERPKILLVINEAPHRLVAATAAAEQGVVIEAKNCEEGRSAIRRNSEVAVAVSDLTLSDGNWLCIHRVIVEHQPGRS